MGDALWVGPVLYAVGAAVVGARMLALGMRRACRWLRRNPPRTLADGLVILIMTPPLASLLVAGMAALMVFWPIVAMFTLQRRHQRERLERFEDAEREAELFQEVRDAARRDPLIVALAWLAATSCADAEPAPEVGSAAAAARILAGAGRALGVQDGGDLQVVSVADVVGPDGSVFTTSVHSAADGRVRMAQPENGFLAGVGRSGGWLRDPEGGVRDPDGFHAFVRGHELHILALTPGARLYEASVRPPTVWDGRAAWAVDARLDSGEPMVAYYAMADTTPLGLLVRYTDPPVAVTWGDWTEQGGLRLFRTARFIEGSDTFTYRYRHIEVGALPDSVFEPPQPSPLSAPSGGR